MRNAIVLVAACAVLNTAGKCDLRPDDSMLRAEISKEELEAEPGYHQMKAALINDVRVWRQLENSLDEGSRKQPSEIKMENGVPTCSLDKAEFEIYTLKSDLADQPYRIEETAFLCRKEGVYYYHYQGGPRKLDIWLGPYKLVRKRVKPDEK